MTTISHANFSGIAPIKNPRHLPDGWAQDALNADVSGTTLKGLPALSLVADNFFASGVESIYRFGQAGGETLTEQQYWFSWNKDIDVCRSQLAKDENEWTFYTGDGAPKATNKNLALPAGQSTVPPNIPHGHRPLGLPAPESPCVVSAGTYLPETEPAELYFSSSDIGRLSPGDSLRVTVAGVSHSVTFRDTSITGVADAFNSVPGIVAVVAEDAVKLTSEAEGTEANIVLESGVGGAITISGVPVTDTTQPTAASVVIPDMVYPYGTPQSSAYGYVISTIRCRLNGGPTFSIYGCSGGFVGGISLWGAEQVITDINTSTRCAAGMDPRGITASLSSSPFRGNIELIPPTGTTEFAVTVTYAAQGTPYVSGAPTTTTRHFTAEAPEADPTTTVSHVVCTITANVLSDFALENGFGVYYNGGTDGGTVLPNDRSPSSVAGAFTAAGQHASVSGENVIVTFYAPIVDAYLVYHPLSGEASSSAGGKTLDPGLKETRVYTYTYVEKIDNFEFESAPAAPSSEVDLYHSQDAIISGFILPPLGYAPTHVRIYRSVSGTYLFVDEVEIGQSRYTDTKDPDFLSEEIPSLTWSPPPPTLQGLTNLPNGIMAGFTGRDIYFCDPYHPHAWPDGYAQAVNWPVVGLGAVDTTLVVLTTGYPFFIQGSHPDSMVVIKGATDQACISKASIVSTGRGVIYASPDGLYMTSPSETVSLLGSYLSRNNWQSWNPSTLRGFLHDNKYYGFTSTHGFVLFLESGQLATLDFSFDLFSGASGYQQPVTAFSDLESDTLYVVMGQGLYKLSNSNSLLPYRWRSKKMTVPQKTGFSAMQVEAEEYTPGTPITALVYADGELLYEKTVDSRRPFRLPVGQHRTWEFELTGQTEIYNVALGQSITELSGV